MHVFVKSSVQLQKITCFLSVAYTMFHNVIFTFFCLGEQISLLLINPGRFGLSYVKMNSVYYSGSFSNGHSRKRTVLLSNSRCHQIDCKTVRIFAYSTHALRACEARTLRARKTLTPRFTDFFADFEKKIDCFAVYVKTLYSHFP